MTHRPRALLAVVLTLAVALATLLVPPGTAAAAGRAAPRLTVSAPAASWSVARGREVVVPVTVRNRGRAVARQTRLRLALPAGVTAPRTTWNLGRVAGGRQRTVKVRLVLRAGAPRTVAVRVTRRGGGAARTTIRLRPRPATTPPTTPPAPPSPTQWRGNFSGPTSNGLGFTLAGDRRTISGWRAVQVDGYCAYLGSAFAWYPTVELPPVAVDADGRFDATFRFPPSDPDDFDETGRLTGTLSGTTVTGTLDYTARWEYGGSVATCTISNAQEAWSAARS